MPRIEKLSVVSGSLAADQPAGPISSTLAWVRAKGISPAWIAAGAAGSILAHGISVRDAAIGGLSAGAASWAWHLIGKRQDSLLALGVAGLVGFLTAR